MNYMVTLAIRSLCKGQKCMLLSQVDAGICSVIKGLFSTLIASFILASEAFPFEECVATHETIVPVSYHTRSITSLTDSQMMVAGLVLSFHCGHRQWIIHR